MRPNTRPVVKWQAMNAHDPVAGRLEAAQPLHADRMFFANCARRGEPDAGCRGLT